MSGPEGGREKGRRGSGEGVERGGKRGGEGGRGGERGWGRAKEGKGARDGLALCTCITVGPQCMPHLPNMMLYSESPCIFS